MIGLLEGANSTIFKVRSGATCVTVTTKLVHVHIFSLSSNKLKVRVVVRSMGLAEWLVLGLDNVAFRNVDLEGLVNGSPRFHRISFFDPEGQFVVLSLNLERGIMHGHPEITLVAQSLVPLKHYLTVHVGEISQFED
jgi:hypothetical protein